MVLLFFPTLGVVLLDINLNSSPRPALFSSSGLRLAHPWSAGVPNPRVSLGVSLECPTPVCPWSVPEVCGVPNPRASLPKKGWGCAK